MSEQAEADLRRGLEEAARLVEQIHGTRLDLAQERAALVADLPKLKAAVDEGDPRPAEPVARDYRDRVRSDVLVLADREGRTLVTLGAAGGRLLETVGAPILLDLGGEGPEVLGHLTLGFALDDAFAARLRALTGSHVAVAKGGRVFASTLPRAHDAALLTVDRQHEIADTGARPASLHGAGVFAYDNNRVGRNSWHASFPGR